MVGISNVVVVVGGVASIVVVTFTAKRVVVIFCVGIFVVVSVAAEGTGVTGEGVAGKAVPLDITSSTPLLLVGVTGGDLSTVVEVLATGASVFEAGLLDGATGEGVASTSPLPSPSAPTSGRLGAEILSEKDNVLVSFLVTTKRTT